MCPSVSLVLMVNEGDRSPRFKSLAPRRARRPPAKPHEQNRFNSFWQKKWKQTSAPAKVLGHCRPLRLPWGLRAVAVPGRSHCQLCLPPPPALCPAAPGSQAGPALGGHVGWQSAHGPSGGADLPGVGGWAAGAGHPGSAGASRASPGAWTSPRHGPPSSGRLASRACACSAPTRRQFWGRGRQEHRQLRCCWRPGLARSAQLGGKPGPRSDARSSLPSGARPGRRLSGRLLAELEHSCGIRRSCSSGCARPCLGSVYTLNGLQLLQRAPRYGSGGRAGPHSWSRLTHLPAWHRRRHAPAEHADARGPAGVRGGGVGGAQRPGSGRVGAHPSRRAGASRATAAQTWVLRRLSSPAEGTLWPAILTLSHWLTGEL